MTQDEIEVINNKNQNPILNGINFYFGIYSVFQEKMNNLVIQVNKSCEEILIKGQNNNSQNVIRFREFADDIFDHVAELQTKKLHY
jgi:hypothetical protein